MYEILDLAGIDREDFFLTNVYVGLIAGDNSRAPFPARTNASFCAWCDAFLDEQIRLMQPRAVVTLGVEAASKLGWPLHAVADAEPRGAVRFKGAAVMHPSAVGHLNSMMKNGNEKWIDHEVRILKQVTAR